ncbi:jg17481 [Pararge aegeria aegeria]|uniref:Jg17481 protein n=1 Tax=Pararge aegeria aegeria TaxID=348720 RepID=A0A8S4RN61_9NEOP|nr:jg17481 [Pararge aegeria aegeria]
MIVIVSLTTGGSTGRIASHRTRKAPLADAGTATRRICHDARRPPGCGALSSLCCHGSVCGMDNHQLPVTYIYSN